MRMRTLRAIAAALVACLSACDSFSLLDQFSDSAPSPTPTPTQNPSGTPAPVSLSAQRNELERGESTRVYPSGGVAPYSYEVLEDQLFYTGSAQCQASAANDTFTAGDSIGGVLLRLRDAAGSSAETRISVRPPAPQGFAVSGATGANQIDLSWSYSDAALIGGFIIEYSADNLPFVEILPRLGSEARSYSHTALNQTKIYTYRMRAVAGDYASVPTASLSARPNS